MILSPENFTWIMKQLGLEPIEEGAWGGSPARSPSLRVKIHQIKDGAMCAMNILGLHHLTVGISTVVTVCLEVDPQKNIRLNNVGWSVLTPGRDRPFACVPWEDRAGSALMLDVLREPKLLGALLDYLEDHTRDH